MPYAVLKVQQPARDPSGAPDPNPSYDGCLRDGEAPISLGPAILVPGKRDGDTWVGCVYKAGHFVVPGVGDVVYR